MPASRGRFQRKGRILYVTRDEELLRKQLGGENLTLEGGGPSRRQHLDRRVDARVGLLLLRRDARPLLPRRAPRRQDREGRDQERRLRRHRQRHLEGLRLEPRDGAYSELKAGVQLVIAKSIEKIYRQNAQNIGLLTSTDFGLIARIERGEEIPIDEFTKGLDPISADDRRARRSLRLQPRAPRRRDVAARDHDRRPADDALREDPRRPRHRRRASPARWASPR